MEFHPFSDQSLPMPPCFKGAWVRPSVFSIQLFSFFLILTWIKGLKTRKKGIGYFVMYFYYYIILYI